MTTVEVGVDPPPQPTVAPVDAVTRLVSLFDDGTARILRGADHSGVVTAHGHIDGARAVAYCTDQRQFGGALGWEGCDRIVEAIGIAVRAGAAVVGMWHCGGARIAEGVASLDGVGRMFAAMVQASGKVPQISVVLGPAAGGAAYGSALTDVVVMAPDSRVFVTGPDVVRSVTGELIDQESLGGPEVHGTRSGVVHVVAQSEAHAVARTRELTGLLARRGELDLRAVGEAADLRCLLPERRERAYDVRPLVRAILDGDDAAAGPDASTFVELQPRWAPNVVVGLGRLTGRTVGVIANNPIRLGGCLDSISAEKASRFVRMCDAFGIPLLVLVDVPGYLPGVDQEWEGIVRRGAKLLHAFAEAVVPRVTVVTRKAFGGAYLAMNSRSMGATAVYAWPDAEIAVMGAKAAVGIIHRRQLASVPDDDRPQLHDRLAEEHARTEGGLRRAVEIGAVDAVIDPSQTRRRLVETLIDAGNPRGRHGNIPL